PLLPLTKLIPSDGVIHEGDTFTVTCYVENIHKCISGDFLLAFDEKIITPGSITMGEFFGNGWMKTQVEAGRIHIVDGVNVSEPPVFGSGTLFAISFHAINSGTVSFSFAGATLYGTNTIISPTPEKAPVRVIHRVAAVINSTSGNNQKGMTAKPLANPLVSTVTDVHKNTLEGVAVKFTISSCPPEAKGQVLSADSTVSNSSGQASCLLTLGDRPGTYTVKAEIMGMEIAPAIFTAVATERYGSVSATILLDTGNDKYLPVPCSTIGVRVVEIDYATIITADVNSCIALPEVLPGTYTMVINPSGASPATFTRVAVVSEQTTNIGTISFLAGDADDDGIVGPKDFVIFYRGFHSFDSEADFNHDKKIDLLDFSALYCNFFRKSSDTYENTQLYAAPEAYDSSNLHASLSMTPNTTVVNKDEVFCVELDICCANSIGIQLPIEYDAAKIEIVNVVKDESLPYKWISYNKESGVIIAGVNPSDPPVSGRGTISLI
ncbi:MAG: hypothetical protein AAB296_02250, partial [Candidatus Desantisbacteria bacterium]